MTATALAPTIAPGVAPTAPIPPMRLSTARKTGLAIAGLRDRIRYGRLDQPTDFTLRLMHQAQLAEIAVRVWGVAEHHQIAAALARADATLAIPVESLPDVPPRSPDATAVESLTWAKSYRAREASQSRRHAQEAARAQAQADVSAMSARQGEVTERVQYLVTAWITHYYREAAHYQRARTGLLGLVRKTPCAPPTYSAPTSTTPAQSCNNGDPGCSQAS